MKTLIIKNVIMLLLRRFVLFNDLDYILFYFGLELSDFSYIDSAIVIICYFNFIFLLGILFVYLFCFENLLYFLYIIFSKISILVFVLKYYISFFYSIIFIFIFNLGDFIIFIGNEFFENPLLLIYEVLNNYFYNFSLMEVFWLNYYYYFYTAPIWSDKEIWSDLINYFNFWPRDLRLYIFIFFLGLFLCIFFILISSLRILFYFKSINFIKLFATFIRFVSINIMVSFLSFFYEYFRRNLFLIKIRPFLNQKKITRYIIKSVSRKDLYEYYLDSYDTQIYSKLFFGKLIHKYSLLRLSDLNRFKLSLDEHLKFKSRYYKYLFQKYKIRQIIKFLSLFISKIDYLLIITQTKNVTIKPIFVENSPKILYHMFSKKVFKKKHVLKKILNFSYSYKKPFLSAYLFRLYILMKLFISKLKKDDRL
jgi:hypothetical protein